MSEADEVVGYTLKLHRSTLQSLREGILKRYGTLYGKMNGEVEEALKLWSRVLKGEVKPPK